MWSSASMLRPDSPTHTCLIQRKASRAQGSGYKLLTLLA
jgi:hypothetical protein